MDLIPKHTLSYTPNSLCSNFPQREISKRLHPYVITHSLSHQQVGGMRGRHIVLTARATRLQSDIITPFIFIQSDRTERERADDVQAKPQLIAFQFACKCSSRAEWRLGEKQCSSPPKGWALTITTANHKSPDWRLTSYTPIRGSISTGNWYCGSWTEEPWWPKRHAKREQMKNGFNTVNRQHVYL